MAVANLTGGSLQYSEDYDSIILTDYFQGKRGGVTLDYSGYPFDFIRAGHVIIKSSTGEHKPMPVNPATVNGVATTNTLVGGSGYTAGSVLLQGGSGSGATATITVTTGAVTAVTIVNAGNGYKVGDVLSISGGTGGTVTVATLSNVAGSYGSLPANHTYYGFAVNTSFKGKVANGIAVRGNLNPKIGANTGASVLGYYNVNPLITAIKTALPVFTFLGDDD